MKESKLRISEVFSSIQGEGIWLGTPSTFIRLSGCNLRCVWCDTPYASWSPEGPMMTIPEIVSKVSEAGVEHVVITGGEPLLFDPVIELAETLKSRHHILTFETAGTIFRELPSDLMSISPKLANSKPSQESGWMERHERTRLDREPLKRLLATYNCQLKFVVNPEAGNDFEEIEALLTQLPALRPDRVLLMPEGRDVESLRKRQKMLVGPCMTRGWRLTPRLHVELFGDTRGT